MIRDKRFNRSAVVQRSRWGMVYITRDGKTRTYDTDKITPASRERLAQFYATRIFADWRYESPVQEPGDDGDNRIPTWRYEPALLCGFCENAVVDPSQPSAFGKPCCDNCASIFEQLDEAFEQHEAARAAGDEEEMHNQNQRIEALAGKLPHWTGSVIIFKSKQAREASAAGRWMQQARKSAQVTGVHNGRTVYRHTPNPFHKPQGWKPVLMPFDADVDDLPV